MINAAVYIALIFRFDGNIPEQFLQAFFDTFVLSSLAKLCIYYFFGLYKSLWSYASIVELLSIVYAVSLGALAEYLFGLILQISPIEDRLSLTWLPLWLIS